MGSILTIDIGATKTRMVEFDSSLSIDEAPSAKISGETEFHTPHHPNECFEILTNTILQNFPEFREHSDDTIIAIALNIALVLGILGYFGIQTTSFAAILAGAGVAIGAAWSGLLGNFAAGAFMLILRPFKVGDFVNIGGVVGTVRELGLFGTVIVTPDNVMTIVGNGRVFGEVIQNFSVLPLRRVERVAQLAIGVDPLDAIARFKAAVAKIPNVSSEMPPEVNLLDIKLEGPQIAVRPYTHTDHYWQVYFDTNEAIVRVCQEAGWPAPSALHQFKQLS